MPRDQSVEAGRPIRARSNLGRRSDVTAIDESGQPFKVGLTDVALQGNFIKFAPASRPESKTMRLNRMYPGSQVKPNLDFILIPKPKTSRIGGRDLSDQAVLEWAQGVIDAVFKA